MTDDPMVVSTRYLTNADGVKVRCNYVGDIFQFEIRYPGPFFHGAVVHTFPGPLARKVLKAAYDEAERRWPERDAD